MSQLQLSFFTHPLSLAWSMNLWQIPHETPFVLLSSLSSILIVKSCFFHCSGMIGKQHMLAIAVFSLDVPWVKLLLWVSWLLYSGSVVICFAGGKIMLSFFINSISCEQVIKLFVLFNFTSNLRWYGSLPHFKKRTFAKFWSLTNISFLLCLSINEFIL